ncbi:MAG: hypothetical protein GY744_10225 [Gammaproteobacteria bacterium]|nr:hypothetical protein [Gammaproteobacteria bacterium]
MIEVSIVLFSLLVEGLVILLTVISVYVFILNKRKNKDREAIKKLVEQIKNQSDIRMQKTGSFLSEKYNFEGNDLDKAVKNIDKAEKKFMQKLINVYHKRDADGLVGMGACVAELIETYKGLSPAIADADADADADTDADTDTELDLADDEQSEVAQEEIALLLEQNKRLTEELSIYKEIMGNIISEFGNKFGSAKENELESKDIIEQVIKIPDITLDIAHLGNSDIEPGPVEQGRGIVQQQNAVDDIQFVESDVNEIKVDESSDHEYTLETTLEVEHLEVDQGDEVNQSDDIKQQAEVKKQAAKPDDFFDEGIDDLIDGIDLSDESL